MLHTKETFVRYRKYILLCFILEFGNGKEGKQPAGALRFHRHSAYTWSTSRTDNPLMGARKLCMSAPFDPSSSGQNDLCLGAYIF